MQEYVRERGERSVRNLEQARGECQGRERWKLFCRGHPLVGARTFMFSRFFFFIGLISSTAFILFLDDWIFMFLHLSISFRQHLMQLATDKAGGILYSSRISISIL